MNVEVAERLHLETRLRRAIEHGELYLVYQPQFNMSGERLLGCEALVRWRDPEHGLIMPSRFIPIAEDTGGGAAGALGAARGLPPGGAMV